MNYEYQYDIDYEHDYDYESEYEHRPFYPKSEEVCFLYCRE